MTKNGDLDLPSISKGPWDQTITFLTKCLLLVSHFIALDDNLIYFFQHDAFYVFCIRNNLTDHLTSDQYNELMYLHRILQQCLRHSRELSQPNTSISQIIPAIMSMKTFLSSHLQGSGFDREIRDAFASNFQSYTSDSQGPRYNTAALLDPRSAFRDNVYPSAKWLTIEKNLVEDFAITEANSERNFNMDLTTISYEDRKTMITDELKRYRQCCTTERPADKSDPFAWWGKHLADMEILAVLAREYLACPAVSIDSKYFFSETGTMTNVSRLYDYSLLETTLTVSGLNQKFIGRGAIPENIPANLLEQLNFTLYRRPTEPRREMKQYTMDAENDYPPLPMVEEVPRKRVRSNEEEPTPAIPAVKSVLPTVAASMGLEETKPEPFLNGAMNGELIVKEEEIDDGYAKALEAKPSPPAALSSNDISETKPPLLNDEADSSKAIDNTIKAVVANRPRPKIIATQKRFIGPNASNDYPKPTPVPGITQPGTPMHTFPRMKAQMPGSHPISSTGGIHVGSPIIIKPTLHGAHPKSGGSGMQPIKPHNFVQKFTQPQQFVQKFKNRGPNPPPPHPHPYKIVTPMAPMRRDTMFGMKEPKLEPFLNFDVKEEPIDEDLGGVYSEMLDKVSFQQLRHK